MKKPLTAKLLTLAAVILGITVFFNVASAIDYIPLATIPDVSEAGKGANLGNYISNMYKFGIRFAGLAAVIAIIYGGIQYIGSESIGNKSHGRKVITDAILGLLLALGSFVILFTLNPKILGESVTISGANLPGTSSASPAPIIGYYEIKVIKKNADGAVVTAPLPAGNTDVYCDTYRINLENEIKREGYTSAALPPNLWPPKSYFIGPCEKKLN